LAKLEADREDFVVEAPAAGIVYYGQFQRGKWAGGATIEQQLRAGGSASPQQVLMTIVSPTPETVRVEVAEKDLSNVRPGVTGHVLPTAFPDRRLPARVAEISPVPIAPGKFDGSIQLAGKADDIVPGMACKVKLTSYQKQDAIAVPGSAVFTDDWDDTQQFVYLVTEDGKHERRTVTVGKKNDKQTEIVKGLNPGDEILTKKPDDAD
jgi:multidrug efflux pump subunit AcrA (membrane-fusion protein)